MLTPEQKARKKIDQLLEAAGWKIQDYKGINLGASLGIAVREVPVTTGFADYMLFVGRKAVGVIEAKTDIVVTARVIEPGGAVKLVGQALDAPVEQLGALRGDRVPQ